jgi:hypothetical protein
MKLTSGEHFSIPEVTEHQSGVIKPQRQQKRSELTSVDWELKPSKSTAEPRVEPVTTSKKAVETREKVQKPITLSSSADQQVLPLTNSAQTETRTKKSKQPTTKKNIAKPQILKDTFTLGKFALSTKAPLKNDFEKIVVLADVQGEEDVLKVSVGQGSMIAPNVLGSVWIQHLKLSGVTAPTMHVLNPEDLNRVIESVANINPVAVKSIKTVATDNIPGYFTAGFCATQAPPAVGTYVTAREVGPDTFRASQNPRDEIEKTLKEVWPNVTSEQFNRFMDRLDNKNYEACMGTTWLDYEPTPVTKEAKWRITYLIAQIGGVAAKTAQENLKKVSPQNIQQYAQFKAWLDSADGKNAFISMTCADVLLGMNDRVVETFHPGNFAFGEGKLWCIDNAKNGPDLGDPVPMNTKTKAAGNPKIYEDWDPFKERSLVEYLRNKILETGLWGDSPDVTIEDVTRNLAAVLTSFSEAADGKPVLEGAEKIKTRIEFITDLLKKQETVTDPLTACEVQIHIALDHEPPQTQSTKSFLKKIVRVKFWSSKSVDNAHAAKDTLREAQELSKLKEAISSAQNDLKNAESKKGDQSYKKAQLELAAAQFASSLYEAAGLLKNTPSYKPSVAEQNVISDLYAQWSESESQLKPLIDMAMNEWESALPGT